MERMNQTEVAGFENKLSRVMKLETAEKITVLKSWVAELELAALQDSEDTELLETVERLLKVETLKFEMEGLMARRAVLV